MQNLMLTAAVPRARRRPSSIAAGSLGLSNLLLHELPTYRTIKPRSTQLPREGKVSR